MRLRRDSDSARRLTNEHLFWLTDAQMARLEPEMLSKVPPGATYNSLWLWVQQFAPAAVA